MVNGTRYNGPPNVVQSNPLLKTETVLHCRVSSTPAYVCTGVCFEIGKFTLEASLEQSDCVILKDRAMKNSGSLYVEPEFSNSQTTPARISCLCRNPASAGTVIVYIVQSSLDLPADTIPALSLFVRRPGGSIAGEVTGG